MRLGMILMRSMILMIKITMQVSQPCGIENGRRHQSRWLNSKAMEALHTPTSRGSQNPNQNLPTMDLKHILGHPNWDPNQLGGPPSSNHGPPSWAPLQNPAGSILVFKLTGRSLTHLQLIGVGHVLNVASMAVSALVESERRTTATSHHHLSGQPGGDTMPMSALWLLPQLALVGVGEAFHFPGQVSLYYQEFPTSLKSMSTAMIGLIIGIAFYLSTAVIGCIRRVTGWLPDNIDNGKVDYVYWMLVAVGVLNFGYYIVCAKLYKYRNLEMVEDGGST
ncbi:hypothetical protein Acr_26g0011640 [Actinidia rufa]|uniref:Major facilitator superfamily protein n=1 Tax=Actinidia rufa TaxID=165716 RepID=A0A7J0H4L3_9ERIC|nr:hypothetical protein Acr_26g0011640 [Actinidia rufa]